MVAVNAALCARGRAGRTSPDDDRARHALGAEVALDELPHLAATLADEADHVDLVRRRAGDHAQQGRLADARTGEDAEALADAAGHERVERPDAERHALGDAGTLERVGRRASARPRAVRGGPEAVDRPAEPVQRAAEQVVGDVDAQRMAGGGHPRARADARRLAQRHQQRAAVAEADDLGRDLAAAAAGVDRADLADLRLQPGRLDDQPDEVATRPYAVQIGGWIAAWRSDQII